MVYYISCIQTLETQGSLAGRTHTIFVNMKGREENKEVTKN
jgi:hypothetical protein